MGDITTQVWDTLNTVGKTYDNISLKLNPKLYFSDLDLYSINYTLYIYNTNPFQSSNSIRYLWYSMSLFTTQNSFQSSNSIILNISVFLILAVGEPVTQLIFTETFWSSWTVGKTFYKS